MVKKKGKSGRTSLKQKYKIKKRVRGRGAEDVITLLFNVTGCIVLCDRPSDLHPAGPRGRERGGAGQRRQPAAA